MLHWSIGAPPPRLVMGLATTKIERETTVMSVLSMLVAFKGEGVWFVRNDAVRTEGHLHYVRSAFKRRVWPRSVRSESKETFYRQLKRSTMH